MKENRKKKILLGVGGVLLSGLLLNQHSLTAQAESVKPFKTKQQVQAKFTTNGTYTVLTVPLLNLLQRNPLLEQF